MAMAKPILLTAGFLLGILWGHPVRGISDPVAAAGLTDFARSALLPQTRSPATLTLEDLPPEFAPLPPTISSEIATQLQALRQRLGQDTLKPDSFFAFVNPENFQLVVGFAGTFANSEARSRFDASLQQLQQPERQQLVLNQIQEGLKAFGDIQITESSERPELTNLGNTAAGMTLMLASESQSLRLDSIAFRRYGTGAFTAVMYADGTQPLIAARDVAARLDRALLKNDIEVSICRLNAPECSR